MASPPPPGGVPYDQYAQPQQPYAQPDGYTQPPPTDPYGTAPPPATGAAHVPRGKRRGYAEQQFEFGTGANAALTPSGTGGAGMGAPPAGYPAADQGYPGAPAAQGQFVQPMMGTMPQGPVQQPAVGYPAQGYDPGMAGVTQQFGNMGMAAQPLGQQGKGQVLNQLFPVDLMQQPFNVAELDMPPPAIILPPNVS